MDWIIAKWKAPIWVQALSTSRNGGVSNGSFTNMNLSYDVGDLPQNVGANRQILGERFGRRVPFLSLQHGTKIIEVTKSDPEDLEADAAIIRNEGLMIGILTADCLPIFFSDKEGRTVALAHAGWRGLSAGIIEKVVAQMKVNPQTMSVFIGPCIHSFGYYVGKNVYDAFMALDSDLYSYFKRSENPEQRGRVHCDLPGIAKHRLKKLGVVDVNIHSADTFRATADFFSYRREGITGRMASVLHVIRDTRAPPIAKRKGISMKELNETMEKEHAQKAKKESVKSVDFDIDFDF